MDPLKAGERRLLSYAADLGVHVDAKGENVPTKSDARSQVARGVGRFSRPRSASSARTSARNEDTEPRALVIEHPVRAGWTIGGTVTPTETTPAWHRFKVHDRAARPR